MPLLFYNTTIDLGLDIILQNKNISIEEFTKKFHKRSSEERKSKQKRSPEKINALLNELIDKELIIKENDILKPTAIAYSILDMEDKIDNPNNETIKKAIELIEYLEKKDLPIKESIKAFKNGKIRNKEFLQHLQQYYSFKASVNTYASATINFLKYIGILTKDRTFTKLGENINSILTIYS
jgi:hypothetical protein